MIKNQQYRFEKPGDVVSSLPKIARSLAAENVLRWYVSQVDEDEIYVEATTCDEKLSQFDDRVTGRYYPGKSAALNIIPTGIGCSIGGYAGDAAPVTNLLASTVDYLVTNPNAVNASDFICLEKNVVYTEGSTIDLFCKGAVDLHLPYSNKIGLIVEKSENWQLDVIFNVVNTVRAVHGVNIVDCVVTEEPIGSRCVQTKSGAFVGTVGNPRVLFDACERLLAEGADAVAVTSNVQDLPLDKYAEHFRGEQPNPVGGTEAVISHLITRKFRVPAAHAPLINLKEMGLGQRVVDARGAGEFTSVSGLACILIGLRRAAQIKPRPNNRVADIINANNLLAVVVPAGALGGVPVICAQEQGIPVIAVRENRTILDITQAKMRLPNVVEVNSYAEAAGIISALKSGVSLQSLSRPLETFRY